MYHNQGNTDLCAITRLWSLRSKFIAILEMISDSDIQLFKLDSVLEGFTIETKKDFQSKAVNVQLSQSESNIDLVLQWWF